MEARLSASRSMVAISSTVGNEENSSGVWMNSAVIRISTEIMIEMASARSSRTGGSGRIRTTRMVSTPTASAISPRFMKAPISPRPGSLMALVAVAGAAVMSVMSTNLPAECRQNPGRLGRTDETKRRQARAMTLPAGSKWIHGW